MPRISFLILSWNHENYIIQCLQSLYNQSCKKFEVLYLDNNSKDNTYQLALGYLENVDFSVKYFRNDSNKSISCNLNFLIDYASGDFVVPLSADDWLETNFVKEKVSFIVENPQVGLLYNGGYFFYQQTNKLEIVDSAKFIRGNVRNQINKLEKSFFFVGVAYSRRLVIECGKWDEKMLIEDLDLIFRMITRTDIDYIPKPLVCYRISVNSISSNLEFMIKGWELFYLKYKSYSGFRSASWIAEKYRAYAALAVDRNEFMAARKLLYKSFSKYPFSLRLMQTVLYYFRKAIAH